MKNCPCAYPSGKCTFPECQKPRPKFRIKKVGMALIGHKDQTLFQVIYPLNNEAYELTKKCNPDSRYFILINQTLKKYLV